MRRAALVAAASFALASPAAAEIAVLGNGTIFKLESHREDGDTYWLALRDGGELALPKSHVRGFVPDEVLEEVTAAAPPRDLSELERLAEETARRHGLDPSLVRAVAAVESAFRPDAVSPKGAQGVMQLMPATAKALGVQDPFDPAANLDGGTRHLRSLIERYEGDLVKALAAYNAGEGAVARYKGLPPYRETREYVKKVMRKYQSER